MNRAPIEEVIEATAPMYGLTPDQMLSRRRFRSISWPRQEIMAALAKRGRSLPDIGRAFGFDHTTALHAKRAVQHRTEGDPDARYSLRSVISRIEELDAKARGQASPVFRSVRGER